MLVPFGVSVSGIALLSTTMAGRTTKSLRGRKVLDGGMGHELKRRGISDGSFLAGVLANEDETPDGDNPVEAVHGDYLAAGCDVVTTNGFVAVPQRMLECGLATDRAGANRRASELIRASVDRAKAAVAKYRTKAGADDANEKTIAGCVPPLTECYFANKVPTDVDDLVPEYAAILSTLLDCGVDVLLAETISTAREARAILRSLSRLRDASSSAIPPLWVSFTVHDDRPTRLRSDEPLDAACSSVVEEAGSLSLPLEAVGVNCSTPSAISAAVPILAGLTAGTNVGVLAYGNCFRTTTSEWMNSLEEGGGSGGAGAPGGSNGRSEDYDEDGYLLPDAYAKYAVAWADAGATIVGGCCGSRPEHMEKVAGVLKRHKS
ncbi:hypothetical protein ACHAWF_017350 [Thalassiosira exigua]